MFTFILEDGTGIANSNSYVSLEDAENYFDTIGSQDWTDICGDIEMSQRALVQASTFFDQRYGLSFRGEPVNSEQGLIFPLTIGGVQTGVPTNLKKAVLALTQVLLEEGVLDHNANYVTALKSESVSLGNGAITESKTYDNSLTNLISNFSVADKYVALLKRQYGVTSSRFVPILMA